MKDRARNLRKNQTKAEQVLWHFFRNRRFFGYKFRRQYVIHGYILDFVCLEQKIIIEVDGSQHLERKEYDTIRTQILSSMGFMVLRFWNNEVLGDLNKVLNAIQIAILPSPGATHHPLPFETGEGNRTIHSMVKQNH